MLLAEERLNAAMRFDVEDADAEHDNHSQSDYSDRSMSGEGAHVKSLGDPVDVVIASVAPDVEEDGRGLKRPLGRLATGASTRKPYRVPKSARI